MEDAGLDVCLSHNPDGTFFGTVTNPEPWDAFFCLFYFISSDIDGLSSINDLLHEWVMKNTDLLVPPANEHVTSPFEAQLAEAGYVKDDDSDTDSDDFFLTVS